METSQIKLAYSINEFCAAHSISRSSFYALLKKGDGPDIIKIGERTLIAAEDAAAWRNRHKRPTLTA